MSASDELEKLNKQACDAILLVTDGMVGCGEKPIEFVIAAFVHQAETIKDLTSIINNHVCHPEGYNP